MMNGEDSKRNEEIDSFTNQKSIEISDQIFEDIRQASLSDGNVIIHQSTKNLKNAKLIAYQISEGIRKSVVIENSHDLINLETDLLSIYSLSVIKPQKS